MELEEPYEATLARIISIHLPGLPPSPRQRIAAIIAGAFGAEIERLVRRRMREAGRSVEAADILAELAVGKQNRDPGLQRRIAVHEAGHAVATKIRSLGRVFRMSLRSPIGSAHEMVFIQYTRRGTAFVTAADIENSMLERLAGRAAEEIVLVEVRAGAVSDLHRATHVATALEVAFDLGVNLLSVGAVSPEDVPGVLLAQQDVATRVEQRLRDCFAVALTLLRTYRPGLEAVAARLLEREMLEGAEVRAIIQQARSRTPRHRGSRSALVTCSAQGSITMIMFLDLEASSLERGSYFIEGA